MKVNGEIIKLNCNENLYKFLKNQGYDINTIAVEKNYEIVPKAMYKEVLLDDEDTLEVVSFVGGG